MMKMTVTGFEKLTDSMNKAIDSVDKKEAEPIVLKGANKLRAHIRRAATKGRTGRLKRGQQRKLLPRRFGYPVAAIVRPNYKIAPHAWLANYGTMGNRFPTAKARKIAPGGTWIWDGRIISHTGRMPALLYFTRTVEAKGPGIQQEIMDNLSQNIDKAWG